MRGQDPGLDRTGQDRTRRAELSWAGLGKWAVPSIYDSHEVQRWDGRQKNLNDSK